MNRRMLFFVLVIAIAAISLLAILRNNKYESASTEFNISTYNVVPDQFTWVKQNIDQPTISFERPSFWIYEGQAINNNQEYAADFRRSAIIDSNNLSIDQKNHFALVLGIQYRIIVDGLTPNARSGNAEDYLNTYFPIQAKNTPQAYRKVIGDKSVIIAYDSGDNSHIYSFFTKNKVIQFRTYDASQAEIAIVEKMIQTFTLQNTAFITPNNFDSYPLEK